MWARREERGSGGPVLRDPLAGNRRAQPYTLNFQDRQQSNDGNYNHHHQQDFVSRIGSKAKHEDIPEWELFPEAHEETYFPPAPPAPIFQQPPQQSGQVPLLSLLGLPARPPPLIDTISQEPPVPIFPGNAAAAPFGNGLGNGSMSFNFQPPTQIQPPPLPTLLPNPLNFQNQGHQSFSGSPLLRFDSDVNRYEETQTLNLQPQWSLEDTEDSSNQVRRSSLQDNSQQPGFNRRPFNNNFQQNNDQAVMSSNQNKFIPKNNAGQNFDRRPPQQQTMSPNFDRRPPQQQTMSPNFDRRPPQQQTMSPNFDRRPPQQQTMSPTLDLRPAQHQRQIPSLFDNEIMSNSNFGQSRTSSNLSFPSSHNQNFQENSSSFESHNPKQWPIPSLSNRNASAGFNSGSNNKTMGNNNNKGQNFQNKRPPPASGTSSCISSNGNSNNINLTPAKPRSSGPLLPTPKLIPYPPPPLHPKSSNVPSATMIRNPRGILKNSCSTSSDYSNFVREGVPSSSENSPVVPYAIGDDEDEDDIEFMTEVQNSGEGSSSNMTHDFFSEKMVQHFTSVLNGKSLDDQLGGLLKYLVLPADFLATRVSIVRNLHVMLSDTFKKCSLQPYGADFIGIGNSDDSVNVFVDLTGKQGPTSQIESRVIEPSQVTKENVDELLELIKEDKNHKFCGQIVRHTNYSFNRVNLPVISFIHSETKVRCNIRFDNYLLVQEAKVIQFVCSLDTRIPSLLALARYWSSVHKVLDTPEEDTKNRFVTLMMLFFLARKKIIPTMAELQSLSVNRENFNNLDIGFCDDYSLVPPNNNPALEDKTVFTLSTLSLLKEFFKLFATAKVKEEVVSLWKAEFIPKENFSVELEGKVLAPDLRKRYKYGVNGKLRTQRIDCGSRLCIQDFQDLAENLTLAVADYDITKFQIECDSACKKLESIMSTGSGNLMDLFVVSDYESYGTPEHREMHKSVYFLFSISDDNSNQSVELLTDSSVIALIKADTSESQP